LLSVVPRKANKVSPILLSACTPPFSAKAKVASQMQPKTKRERESKP